MRRFSRAGVIAQPLSNEAQCEQAERPIAVGIAALGGLERPFQRSARELFVSCFRKETRETSLRHGLAQGVAIRGARYGSLGEEPRPFGLASALQRLREVRVGKGQIKADLMSFEPGYGSLQIG